MNCAMVLQSKAVSEKGAELDGVVAMMMMIYTVLNYTVIYTRPWLQYSPIP